MNFIDLSLQDICSISLHWSSDCNMACKYCYIKKEKECMMNLNKEIVQSLEDGSYIENIKKVFHSPELINPIENISLWGAEPTINGIYFEKTIAALLDYFPNVTDFMFSTNALIGGQWIYDKFFVPLYNYCESHKRKLSWELQLSLDGPPEFNDDSRHEGATQSTIDTLKLILQKAPMQSDYLTVNILSKATLDVSYMRIMNQRGIECFNWYYQFFDKIQQEALELAKDKHYINLSMNNAPTLVDPGFHTIDDGKTLREWIDNLLYVDRNKIPTYRGYPLFGQLMANIESALRNEMIAKNPVAYENMCFSCSAGRSNITIDHKGQLYICNRLARNLALPIEEQKKAAMRSNTNLFTSDRRWVMKTWGSQAFHNDILSRRYIFDGLVITMAHYGQIDKKYFNNADARNFLFYLCMGLWCHIGIEEDLTQNSSLMCTSCLKLLGNGAADAMARYYKISIDRGEIFPWKTVM